MNNRFEHFKKRAIARYGASFNYDYFEYINAKTKSKIICKKHGAFFQNPDKHLQCKYPCPKCLREHRSECATERCKRSDSRFKGRVTSSIQFMRKVSVKFGDKYKVDLTGYSGMEGARIKIECPIHGVFYKTPYLFLIGQGCNACGNIRRITSKTKPYADFVSKANKVHAFRYKYPHTNADIYQSRKTIVVIECIEHGIFKKKAQKHLAGQGCFYCRLSELKREGALPGGYNNAIFLRNPELAATKGTLYYLSIDEGTFFKIGITRVSVARRIKGIISKSNGSIKKVDILFQKKGKMADIYSVEQQLLLVFDRERVCTEYSNELFNRDISKDPLFRGIFNC